MLEEMKTLWGHYRKTTLVCMAAAAFASSALTYYIVT
jgi:hypothetical protein